MDEPVAGNTACIEIRLCFRKGNYYMSLVGTAVKNSRFSRVPQCSFIIVISGVSFLFGEVSPARVFTFCCHLIIHSSKTRFPLPFGKTIVFCPFLLVIFLPHQVSSQTTMHLLFPGPLNVMNKSSSPKVFFVVVVLLFLTFYFAHSCRVLQ